MPDPVDRRMEELADLTEDLGLEWESREGQADAETARQLVDIDFTTKTVVRYEPVPPESPEVGDYTETRVRENAHYEFVVKKRPKCPTCGYILTGEDDPLHLPGKCWQCGRHVCPECRAECHTCDRVMCPVHTGGHGIEDEPLCPGHARDVAREVQHDRELDLRQQDWQEVKTRLDHDRQREEQAWKQVHERAKLEIEGRQKRFDNKLQAARLQLDAWRLKTALQQRAAEQTRQTIQSNLQPAHATALRKRAPKQRGRKQAPNPRIEK